MSDSAQQTKIGEARGGEHRCWPAFVGGLRRFADDQHAARRQQFACPAGGYCWGSEAAGCDHIKTMSLGDRKIANIATENDNVLQAQRPHRPLQ